MPGLREEPAGESVPTTMDTFIRGVARSPSTSPPVFLAIGTVLPGGYEIRDRLGIGGMAVVYRAFDRRLGREVAIKVPRVEGRGAEEREQLVRMFEREAAVTAGLNHPGIITLHHVGEHGGAPFLVLELLTGETLAARLARRKRLELAEATTVLDGILAALGHAHERGVIHRDLTPRNVFLTTDDRIKVLDFGVAVEAVTEVGTVTRGAGTPGYMAPEHGEQPDARADLWAAAVLFLECVTGARPTGDAPAGELPADVPDPLRRVVTRALSSDPARRPTAASEMRAAIAPLARAARPAGRRRWRLVAAVAVLAVVAGALVAYAALAGQGPGGPRLIAPRAGRWRGDPPAATPWEVRLQRKDPTTFVYENSNSANGALTRGELTLELLDDGTSILAGRTADVRTCKTCPMSVGMVEFIVLSPTSLYQNKAAFGPDHEHYAEWFPPYRYAWRGPASSVAE